MSLGKIVDKIEKKDWFLYQAGLLLACLLFIASFVAANYSLYSPVFPGHLKEALYWAHLKRGILLFGISVFGTVIVDFFWVFLVKKGLLDEDSFIEY